MQRDDNPKLKRKSGGVLRDWGRNNVNEVNGNYMYFMIFTLRRFDSIVNTASGLQLDFLSEWNLNHSKLTFLDIYLNSILRFISIDNHNSTKSY